MDLLEIIVLAIVQGLTEFLPVSSSGHLVVAEALFEALGWESIPDQIEVNVVLHLGTLLAVLVYFWRSIWRLIGQDRRVVPLLIVGTIPLVIVGLTLKFLAPQALEDPLLAGLMFPLTAAILLWSSRRPVGETEYVDLGFREVILIGLLQAVAALPGISRSGATIAGGLIVGLRRESAATFAFLLAIPAIGGAGVLETASMLKERLGSTVAPADVTPLPFLVVGTVVSFVVGLASLWLLIRLVQRGHLAWFAYWLIPLGIAVTCWQLS